MKGSTRIALCLLAVVSLLVAAAPVRAVSGAVFTVYPNGVDDTAALQQASSVKGQGVLLATVCVSNACDDACMRQIASSPRYFFQGVSI